MTKTDPNVKLKLDRHLTNFATSFLENFMFRTAKWKRYLEKWGAKSEKHVFLAKLNLRDHHALTHSLSAPAVLFHWNATCAFLFLVKSTCKNRRWITPTKASAGNNNRAGRFINAIRRICEAARVCPWRPGDWYCFHTLSIFSESIGILLALVLKQTFDTQEPVNKYIKTNKGIGSNREL